MGQRVIDSWCKQLVGSAFTWGTTDCHQLLFEFVKLNNPGWNDPHNIGALRGTYSTPLQAAKVARKLKIAEWFEELGYSATRVNRIETGDIVWVKTDRGYDMYMPVVFNQTVICGDPSDDIIKLRHISELDHYDYQVYRRNICHKP